MLNNWAQLYGRQLVDDSDLATSLARSEGGFYDVWPSSAHVGGLWLAVPHSIIGNAVAYRRSWLREAGGPQDPKTWGGGRELFAPPKPKGKADGPNPRPTVGGAPPLLYPMPWWL